MQFAPHLERSVHTTPPPQLEDAPLSWGIFFVVEMLGIEPRSICYLIVLLRAQSTGNCRDHLHCVRQQ